ncbi:hypothetical protein [uncultured Microbulbifer sp.]|uniref:helix-turn-helix domain-containing protein n=1 Tax=uncultured Microbulbifer sp. TaxID=348147 RepID=UPI0026158F76|nr:hypothetical protein [uncultured Microbulbifer sp.]
MASMDITQKRNRYADAGSVGLSEACLARFDSGYYSPPSALEIRRLLAVYQLSGACVAEILGVSDSRTVRRWTSGESRISYSTWRLLLWELGLVVAD